MFVEGRNAVSRREAEMGECSVHGRKLSGRKLGNLETKMSKFIGCLNAGTYMMRIIDLGIIVMNGGHLIKYPRNWKRTRAP
jgi:hypothetical protein